jgi:hypothetical protein
MPLSFLRVPHLLGHLILLGAVDGLAQQSTPDSVAAVEARLPRPTSPQGHDRFDLSEASQARLKQWVPALWRKLSQRENTHLLVLAEPRFLEIWRDPADRLLSADQPLTEVFAKALASRFFMTGGVRTSLPSAKDAFAPGISVRVIAEQGQSLVDAPSILQSVARQAPVDAVLLCHGFSEAETGLSPAEFSSHLKRAGQAVRELGADVIVVTPWIPMSERPEVSLGQTRPLADIALQAAEDEGWFAVDLGQCLDGFELPPNDAAHEGERFARVIDAWKAFFHEEPEGRYLPRAKLHQRLGQLVYDRLMAPAANQPISVSKARAVWKKTGGLELSWEWIQQTQSPFDLTALPLISSGWRPREAQSQVTLAPGVKQSLSALYLPSETANAIQESEVRLPWLISDGRKIWMQTMRAPVEPIVVLWEPSVTFNHEGKLSPAVQLLNQSGEDLVGRWELEGAGAKQSGDIRLKQGAGMSLDATLTPPALEDATQTFDMKLKIQMGELTLERHKALIIARNIGLKQHVPMLPAQSTQAGRVTFSAEADAGQLSLIAEVAGSSVLLPAAEGNPAWIMEAQLDARSYGKRLEEGSTWPIKAHGTASGKSRGKVEAIQPWAFGSGYAAVFDPDQFKAEFTPLEGDRYQIKLILPRSYLYLHEWALDNGNSQLGVNVRVRLNTESGFQTWTLIPELPLAHHVANLRVLELTAQPTQRMTVHWR